MSKLNKEVSKVLADKWYTNKPVEEHADALIDIICLVLNDKLSVNDDSFAGMDIGTVPHKNDDELRDLLKSKYTIVIDGVDYIQVSLLQCVINSVRNFDESHNKGANS